MSPFSTPLFLNHPAGVHEADVHPAVIHVAGLHPAGNHPALNRLSTITRLSIAGSQSLDGAQRARATLPGRIRPAAYRSFGSSSFVLFGVPGAGMTVTKGGESIGRV
jgi:hypothetical protein